MNELENRGNLPPEVLKPREGYRETPVCIIDEDNAVYSKSYYCGEDESKALKWLAKVDKSLAEKAAKEKSAMVRARIQMNRMQREQAKRERISEYIDWALLVALCTEFIAVLRWIV